MDVERFKKFKDDFEKFGTYIEKSEIDFVIKTVEAQQSLIEMLINHQKEYTDECIIQYKDEIEELKQENEDLENHIKTLNDIVGMYEQASEVEENG